MLNRIDSVATMSYRLVWSKIGNTMSLHDIVGRGGRTLDRSTRSVRHAASQETRRRLRRRARRWLGLVHLGRNATWNASESNSKDLVLSNSHFRLSTLLPPHQNNDIVVTAVHSIGPMTVGLSLSLSWHCQPVALEYVCTTMIIMTTMSWHCHSRS